MMGMYRIGRLLDGSGTVGGECGVNYRSVNSKWGDEKTPGGRIGC